MSDSRAVGDQNGGDQNGGDPADSGSTNRGPTDGSPAGGDLGTCIREVAEFLADSRPWHTGEFSGAVPLMFALVPTSLLAETDPQLLGLLDDAGLTPVEQGPLYDDPDLPAAALEELLTTVSWPDDVAGCLLVREIVVLPPGAQQAAGATTPPSAPGAGRTPARLYAAVLRDGTRLCLLQLFPHATGSSHSGESADPAAESGSIHGGGNDGDGDGDGDTVRLLRYEGLGAGLLDALHATFAPHDGAE